MQPRGAGAVKRHPAEQYHARLGARPDDEAYPFEVGLKALRQEAGKKASVKRMSRRSFHRPPGTMLL
jgi:hypothetical protein